MLQPPPSEPASLEDVPSTPIAGTRLYRVWRGGSTVDRSDPWWFSSNVGPSGGRFDLAAPLGTLYTSTSRAGALLESLQAVLINLPVEELRARRLATIAVPDRARPAADLTDRRLAGRGVTAAVWAGADRGLTQQWAAALRRDGWWVLHAGLQHDPSGKLRAVAVFGPAGDSSPTLGGEWSSTVSELADDSSVRAELERFGVAVRGPGELPLS